MVRLENDVDIVIGVDTHKDTHTASFVTPVGGSLEVLVIDTDPNGYRRVLQVAQGWQRRVGDRRHRELRCRTRPLLARGGRTSHRDRPPETAGRAQRFEDRLAGRHPCCA